MGHLYLEELKTYEGDYWGLKNDPREAEWIQERKIYGFDNTETWNLDSAFYLWLYERLRRYVDIGGQVVNLHYHRFTFKDKEYFQDELIDMMIERIKYCFSEEYDEFNKEEYDYVHEIEQIWAIILPAMWW